MSVDYFVCEYCGETFSDAGHFVTCESCGTNWCSDECANEDGYVPVHCDKHHILDNMDLMEKYRESHCNSNSCYECQNYVPDSCKWCRNEDYTNETLLEKALKMLNMTRQELVDLINT